MKVVCALSNLFKGNKIRSTGWDEGDYQHQQKNGDTIFYSAVDDESIVIDSDNLNRNLSAPLSRASTTSRRRAPTIFPRSRKSRPRPCAARTPRPPRA